MQFIIFDITAKYDLFKHYLVALKEQNLRWQITCSQLQSPHIEIANNCFQTTISVVCVLLS